MISIRNFHCFESRFIMQVRLLKVIVAGAFCMQTGIGILILYLVAIVMTKLHDET